MGHLTNPRGFRVGKVIPWEYREYRYKGEGLKSIYFFGAVAENVRRRLRAYFRPLKFSFTFSHCRVKRLNKKILVKVYAFNGQYDQHVRALKHKLWGHRGRRAKFLRKKQRAKKRRNRANYYYFWKKPRQVRRQRKARLSRLTRIKYLKFRRSRKSRSSFDSRRSKLALKKTFLLKSTLRFWLRTKKRGRSKIFESTFIGLQNLLSNRLSIDFRNYFFPGFRPFEVKFIHLDFNTMSAEGFADYVKRRVALNYKPANIIRPLYREARCSPDIRGLFFKLKGRYSRKPRSLVNKKVFRYGKVAFSSVESKLDYCFKRFENRFGTCSIKVWLSRF